MTCSLEEYYGISDEQTVPKSYDYTRGGHGKVLVKE